ncbi:hypothetical protein ACOSQ3_027025 [Xanthoceras sorbifolium]
MVIIFLYKAYHEPFCPVCNFGTETILLALWGNASIGLGTVIHNSQGLVMLSSAHKLDAFVSIGTVQALALRQGLLLVKEAGYGLCVELDVLVDVKLIKDGNPPLSMI